MNPSIAAPTRKTASDLAKLMPPFLDLKAQFSEIRDEILSAITEVLESQHFILGPEVEALEREISAHTGARFAIGCASGSDALLLALLGLEVQSGDEIITTPFTFVATAGAIARIGAKPVFVDIDPATFNIDPAQIENAITPRTRAILPVHLFGMAADMDAILEVAARRELPVIEDAAQSIGARYRGKAAGNLGAMGCFSFFPSKNLGGAGDGGMITTNDQKLGERLRLLRVHGSRKKYEYEIVGINSRLDALQAAILRVKLRHLEAWTEGRRGNADQYRALFAEFELTKRVTLPQVPAGRTHVYNQFVIRVAERDALQAFLKERGIPTEVYYPSPLHLERAFQYLGYNAGAFPAAEVASKQVIALPIYPELRGEQQRSIVSGIAEFYETR
ncbi:MAG TPA: DegT/DnrJ/EryC1/StrS family aminotransferase [Candidatus Acidoferrales bacterium]|nr:DegT/DnrJ/EryC1/StrS family aminotransferase [Candidatus Acidoferrales bacterium]